MSWHSADKVQNFKERIRKISAQLAIDRHTNLNTESQRAVRKAEKYDLEECKGIFLVNQVTVKGRRGALSSCVLEPQLEEFKRKKSLKSRLLLRRSINYDEFQLGEVKKIVNYQTLPKRRISM